MEIDFSDSVIKLFSSVSLVVFLFLSYHVIKEDLASQKIPNKLILKFMKIGLFMCVTLLVYGLLKDNQFAVNYAKILLLNAAVALVCGYLLWYFDLFSPGDSKYFALAALLVPLESYTYQYVPGFPALLILINAYVIAFLLMFAYTLYVLAGRAVTAVAAGDLSKENIRRVADSVMEKLKAPAFWVSLAGMLLYMASILLIMRDSINVIQGFFNFSPGHFTLITVLILYFAGSRLQGLMNDNKIVARAAYFVFAGVISFQYFILRQNVFHMIAETVAASFFMIVFIPIAKYVIDLYYGTMENNKVEYIRMGIVLTEETVEKFQTDWGVEVPALVPLSDSQSQSVKDNIPNNEKICTVKHITFGPFIFIGAMFTFLLRHTIIHYL